MLIEDRAAAVTSEIEVAVVGEVDDGWFGGRGAVRNTQRMAFQRVPDMDGQLAGETHISIGADESHLNAAGNRMGAPYFPVEAQRAAMQCIRTVVRRDVKGSAIDGERAFCKAVAVAANDGPKVRARVGLILLNGVIPKDDIGALPAVVGASMLTTRAPKVVIRTVSSPLVRVYRSTGCPAGVMPQADLVVPA